MKKWLKVVIALLIIIAISVGIYFIFRALGITDINKLQEVIKSCGAWGWVVFLLIQIAVTTLLCFVPATSMLFITLGVLMFGATWQTFLLCFGGVIISSICMDLIGRFGGSKLIVKLIGQQSYDNALKLLETKGVVYVPLMYLLPIFPDDAICMCCGAMKMKWWVHYIEIVLCRGIGCATIVFGLNLLPKDLIDNLKAFNWTYIGQHIFEYITMITVIVFWVIVLLVVANKIDKWLQKRKDKKNGQESLGDKGTEQAKN